MSRGRLALARLGLVALLAGSPWGCGFVRDTVATQLPFFSVPREKVVAVAMRRVDPFRDFPQLGPGQTSDLATLERAVDARLVSYGDHVRPDPPFRCIAELLCVSDAQIRDEEVYSAGYMNELLYYDRIVGVTIRRSFVEKFDALSLASFLIAYRRETQAPDAVKLRREDERAGLRDPSARPFIVHPGDLCDISTTTELLTGLLTVKQCLRGEGAPPFYSLAGNHDGLVFGNVPNRWADMRMLGTNLSEFVLGHLLIDGAEGDGFGFGRNELVRRFGPDSIGLEHPSTRQWALASGKLLRHGVRGMTAARGQLVLLLGPETVERRPVCESGWQGRAARQARRLIDVAGERQRRGDGADHGDLSVPLLFGSAIEVDDHVDGGEMMLGYYHWDQPLARPVGRLRGIRYVALDTRSPSGQDSGHIGLVQLGWLYNQLADALARRYAVVIVAHHAPWMIHSPVRLPFTGPRANAILCRMLRRFPNVVAWLYGHGHWNGHRLWPNDRGLPVIQTGALCDFPRVGRKLWLYAAAGDDGAHEVRIAWEFVRPAGSPTREGRLLDAVLATSMADALKEHNQSTDTWVARWCRLKCGFGVLDRVSEKWRTVDVGWGEWCDTHLRNGEARVSIRFDGGSSGERRSLLASRALFGHRLERVERLRDHFGCAPVLRAPAARAADRAPAFAKPSGVAALRADDGRRVLIVADQGAGHALFRATWRGDTAGLARGAGWQKLELGGPGLEDVEALAPWGDRALFVVCSQSRTPARGVTRASRSRLALVTLSPDLGAVESLALYDGLREGLVDHLERAFPRARPAPHDPTLRERLVRKAWSLVFAEEGRAPETEAPTAFPWRTAHGIYQWAIGRAAEAGGPLAAGTDAVAQRRPAGGGLNVEGAVAWDGMLLLGLREPCTAEGHPILVPLMNPEQVARGQEPPEFGPPLILRIPPAGSAHRIVMWQKPPSRAELNRRKATTPLAVDAAGLTARDVDPRAFGLLDEAVPEGIAVIEDADPEQDQLILVQDPETFVRDDVFIGAARRNRALQERR